MAWEAIGGPCGSVEISSACAATCFSIQAVRPTHPEPSANVWTNTITADQLHRFVGSATACAEWRRAFGTRASCPIRDVGTVLASQVLETMAVFPGLAAAAVATASNLSAAASVFVRELSAPAGLNCLPTPLLMSPHARRACCCRALHVGRMSMHMHEHAQACASMHEHARALMSMHEHA